MQGTIGEFESSAAAEAAVRALESKDFSIQNVLIADQKQRMWRKLHPRRRKGRSSANFLVFMIDSAENIERGRALLQQAQAATESAA